MFKWQKKGLIFSPDNNFEWMHSHAQCPFPVDFGSFIRIYFATRENYKSGACRAFGGFVDVDKYDLKKILRISSEPIMELGGIGEFDEYGSMPISVLKHHDEYYLYYVGWSRGYSVPYDWQIGFAKSSDGVKFYKVGKGPLIGPTLFEPYLNSTPVVYKFSDTEWHMFYHTGLNWIQGEEKLESQYAIRHATSNDGINWNRKYKNIIPLKVPNECQTTPALVRLQDKYHMFFCYREGLDFRKNRAKSYRIGYACSDDLITWVRDDTKAGIDVSDHGWDSDMVEYPHISKINDKYLMFYCGNHFGKTGFGYAELEC